MKTRALVCCDRAIVCAGLQALLEQHNMLVHAERTLQAAVRASEKFTPDVVVIVAPVLSLHHSRELAALASRFKVVFLTRSEESSLMPDAVRAGVRVGIRAVLSVEQSEPLELIQTLRTVVEMDSMIFPAAAMHNLDPAAESDTHGDPAFRFLEILTTREAEIMLLLTQGRSNAEIAIKLSISAATVRSHVHHLLRKLDASTRAQAVAIAYDTGLVSTLEQKLLGAKPTGRE